jgi:hypothetical protein
MKRGTVAASSGEDVGKIRSPRKEKNRGEIRDIVHRFPKP